MSAREPGSQGYASFRQERAIGQAAIPGKARLTAALPLSCRHCLTAASGPDRFLHFERSWSHSLVRHCLPMTEDAVCLAVLACIVRTMALIDRQWCDSGLEASSPCECARFLQVFSPPFSPSWDRRWQLAVGGCCCCCCTDSCTVFAPFRPGHPTCLRIPCSCPRRVAAAFRFSSCVGATVARHRSRLTGNPERCACMGREEKHKSERQSSETWSRQRRCH